MVSVCVCVYACVGRKLIINQLRIGISIGISIIICRAFSFVSPCSLLPERALNKRWHMQVYGKGPQDCLGNMWATYFSFIIFLFFSFFCLCFCSYTQFLEVEGYYGYL